jgi:hypothetical protein
MRAVQTWKLDWIANEEDRKIIADYIPISLIRKHLQGESSNIPYRIRRAPGASDCRYTGENFGFLADFVKEVC